MSKSVLVRVALKGSLALILVAGLALPVCAQGQTPTRPGGTDRDTSDILRRLREQRSGRESTSSRFSSRDEQQEQDEQEPPGPRTGLDRSRQQQKPTVPESRQRQQQPQPPAGRSPRGRTPSGVRPVTGKGQAGAKPSIQKAGEGAQGEVIVHGEGVFEPVLNRELEYGEVPDVGEPLTLSGPMPMTDFLDALSMATNWNVLVSEAAQEVTLQFWITEATPQKALEILRFNDIYYEFDPESQYLYVQTKKEYLDKQYGKIQHEVFQIENVNIGYAETMLSSLLSSKGRLITDTRTMHIYVWDTKDNIEKMKETIEQIDVPLKNMEFDIQHADLADVQSVLEALLSQTGTLVADPRTGQLLIWDVPEVLQKMADTVERLDVPLETKVFALKHVSVDAVVESIEVLLSERGIVQVDPRSNTIIVSDLAARQEQIAEVLDTLDQQLRSRTWMLKYAETDAMADKLESIIPEEMGLITVDEKNHQITVTAVPEQLDRVDELIKTWDIKRKQVQIEAYLVTVGSNIARNLGVNWNYFNSTGNAPYSLQFGGAVPTWGATSADTADADGDGNGNSGGGNALQTSQRVAVGQLPQAIPLRNWITGEPITDMQGNQVIKEITGTNVSAVIEYLDSEGHAKVLSHPRVTVQDGEEAVFERISQVPYVTSTTYDSYGGYDRTSNTDDNYRYGYGSYRPSNRIDFIEVGTILMVIPRIAQDGNILLEISAEESTYQMREVVGASETSTVPEKMQNRTETQVLVHDGQTVVIGGLRTGSIDDKVEKLPLLGDIPLLGRAFRMTQKQHDNKELLIFITVTLVDEFTFPEAERLARVEEELSIERREDELTSWGRVGSKVLGAKDEIPVSIGQNGDMHSNGGPVTLEDLRKTFFDANTKTATVIIRKHPRGPASVERRVTEIAMEAGLKVEFDSSYIPFVPAYPDRAADHSETEEPANEILIPADRTEEPEGDESITTNPVTTNIAQPGQGEHGSGPGEEKERAVP